METAGLKFAKPKHKKKPNHSRRNKTRARSKMIRELDAQARQEVFERDGGVCVRCQKRERAVQWCHVFSRRHLNLRWESDNALTLCGGDHLWWHHEPLLAIDWFRKTYPDRYDKLLAVHKVNPKVSVSDKYEALSLVVASNLHETNRTVTPQLEG